MTSPELHAANAANLLSLLETQGFRIRFLRTFAESPRQARRLVVRWLALGWSSPGGMATDLARRR
jgi:hypothetical protein